jgi:hypothetical protein
MKTSLIRTAMIVLGYALALSVEAQVSKAGNGYLLRVKYHQGQVLRYQLNTKTSDNTNQSIDVSIPIKMRVTGVQGTTYTLRTAVGPVKVGSRQMGRPKVKEAKIDSLGRASVGASNPGMASSFPEKAVKIGDTWTSTMPMAQLGGNVNAKFRFMGIKKVQGQDVALINLGITSSGGPFTSQGSGVIHVLVSDGSLESMTMAIHMKRPDRAIQIATSMVRQG